MAAGVFIIQELRRVGNVVGGSQAADGGERFEWTNDKRSAPLKPWDIGAKQRTAKTWYAGAKRPSEQVLGPEFKDQTFRGGFDDRYNTPGFAVAEKARFEAMCERGNYVRVSFQQEAWEGLITDWDLTYRRAWDIPYAFTLSVHGRPEDRALDDRSPPTALSSAQVFDGVDIGVQALLDTHSSQDTAQLAGGTADAVLANLGAIATQRDDVADALDQRDVRPGTHPFRQLATKLRAMHNASTDLLEQLASVRADTEVVTLTALRMLDFEGWSRSLRYQARIVMNTSRNGANSLEERDEARAERTYRPRAGELLYSVSTRFYGTPHAWRLIADRNRLRYFKLTGEELLIIPERGQS